MSDGNRSDGWGGYIVLLLVGAGAWFFFIQPYYQKEAHKKAIRLVLQCDSRSTTKAASVEAVVARMRGIDLSNCPSDFT